MLLCVVNVVDELISAHLIPPECNITLLGTSFPLNFPLFILELLPHLEYLIHIHHFYLAPHRARPAVGDIQHVFYNLHLFEKLGNAAGHLDNFILCQQYFFAILCC